MVGKKRKLGTRPYKTYIEESLQRAVMLVKSGELTKRQATEQFGISKSTIHRKGHDQNLLPVGRPCVLSNDEEEELVRGLITASKWGFPLTSIDISFVIKSYLDSDGRIELRFNKNTPGSDWIRAYLSRHKNDLTVRLCENVKRARVAVSYESIEQYFNELSLTLEGVDSDVIINYDETNMTDDPGRKKVIVRRGIKHAECIKDTSKSSTSVMFSGTASGVILPVYVVYKADHLYDSWTQDGPKGARYNRSKSG